MKPASYPKTPELNKLSKIADKSHIIGEFLEQLGYEGIVLCVLDDNDNTVPLNQPIEVTLAKYFKINLAKIEAERQAVLTHIRSTS